MLCEWNLTKLPNEPCMLCNWKLYNTEWVPNHLMKCGKYTRLKREKETYRSCDQEKKGQNEAMRLHGYESNNERVKIGMIRMEVIS